MLQTRHPYVVKDFSDEMINSLKEAVNIAKSELDGPPIAAFDADGTLWNTDVGEVFLNYQIEHMVLDLPANPYEYYKSLRYSDSNGDEALDWIVQVNAGQKIDDVRACASECFKNMKASIPIFGPMKKFIDFLHSEDYEVFVVTASCKWAVEPFGALFDINPENVIGSCSKLKGDIVTQEMELRTRKEGKVEGLLRSTNGNKPALASGNTSNDLALLESATHIKLAVQSNPDSYIHDSEEALRKTASERGWFSHQYY